jgi:hypothetical protein
LKAAERAGLSAAGGPSKTRTLPVLTFEAAGHIFAVRAADVRRIVPPGQPLPEGTSVVDVVGLLSAESPRARRRCLILLRAGGPAGRPMAITASQAREVTDLNTDLLLPLPGYLFCGENPFLGMVPPAGGGEGRAVFLIGAPEKLLDSAGSR